MVDLVQIKDVAKRAGCGTSTVSRVLNNSGYVSKETRERIERAIKELIYVPNQMGRNLKRLSSHLVALFVPTISHPFFSKIAYYIENYLYKYGFRMIIVSSQDNKEKEVKLLDMIKNKQVDGIIFITTHIYDDVNFEGMSIVTLDRKIPGVPCIASNNYESTYEAVEYLVKLGCKKIGYIGGITKVGSEVEKRYEAYCDVMNKYQLEIVDCRKEMLHGEEYNISKEFIDENPDLDAIFAQSDIFAHCCYLIELQRGRKIPEDIKIVGYDGVMDEIYQHPTFTVVKQNLNKLGEKIVQQLVRRMKKKKCEKLSIVPADFIIGETTEVK